MARDLLAVVGYETGGAEELDQSAANLPSAATTPAPPSSKETYVGKHDWKSTSITLSAPFVNGEWITLSFWIRFTFETPSTLFPFLKIPDTGGGNYLQLKYMASPDVRKLELFDANDVSIASWAGVFKDTWYNIEIKFKPQSDSSDVKVYMDRVEKVSVTGKDCNPGNATDAIQVMFNNPESTGRVFYLSNIIVESDDGATITTVDTLGKDRVVMGPYISAHGNWTPDFGDNLTVGTWANVAEVPRDDAVTAQYDSASPAPQGGVTTHDGSKSGPKDDSEVDGTILGASWGWRAKRTSGASSNQQIKRKWGASTVTSSDNTVSQNSSLTTSFQNFWEVRSASHADTPTATEYFQIGFGVASPLDSKDVILGEMWCFLVHQEPPPSETILDYERKTRGAGRGVMVGAA